MRHTFMLCTALVAAMAAQSTAAQDRATSSELPRVVEAAVFAGPEFPSLLPDLKVDGYELLESSLTVEDKGGKVSWAPLLLRPRYVDALSETRLQVSQRNDLTTLGAAVRYNPLSPRSGRGKRLWLEMNATPSREKQQLRQEILLALQMARGKQADANAKVVPEYAEAAKRVQLLADELSKLENESERPTLAAEHRAAVRELAELEDVARAKRLERARASGDGLDLGLHEVASLEAQLKTVEGEIESAFSRAVFAYSERLFQSKIPVLGVSYNAMFFSVLGGDESDADGDGLADQSERLASQTVAGTVDVRLGSRGQVSGLISYARERESAEAETKLKSSLGYGATVGYIIRILNPGYRSTSDYRNSFFIPSLVAGLALEGKTCREDDKSSCPNAVESELVLTPFLDFKISRTAQFRIGFPVRRREVFMNDPQVGAGITTLVSFQLGNGS